MVSSRFYNYFWNLRADNMKPQKGSKIYLQMDLRMELGTGPRTEISGGARRAVGPLARQVTGKWF